MRLGKAKSSIVVMKVLPVAKSHLTRRCWRTVFPPFRGSKTAAKLCVIPKSECPLCVAPSLSIHGRSCASALAFLGEWNAPNPD